jgi:hypothetical protein
MFIYYVYRLVHKTSGQEYFGSRKTAQVDPYDDLGVKYFSSSKIVKEIGFAEFYHEVVAVYDSFTECYWEEQRLIESIFNSGKCLNRSFYRQTDNSRVFSMTGRTQTREHIEKRAARQRGKITKRKGLPETLKHMKRMTEARLKKYPAGVFKHSEESKEKNRQAHIGRRDSDETKRKKSKSASGKPKFWLKGRTLTPEHIQRGNESRAKNRETWSQEKKDKVAKQISDKLKGKPKTYQTNCAKKFMCRITDKKEMSKATAALCFKDNKNDFW